jgi:hypothetical protein
MQIPIKTPQCFKLNFDFRVSVKDAVTALKFAFYVNIGNFMKSKCCFLLRCVLHIEQQISL